MRVLFDCDPGIDDTLALIYLTAAHHEGRIELDAVTTTSGNADATQCAMNAAWILGLCGLPAVPVAAGTPAPLAVSLLTTPETHGENGLGYVTAPQRNVDDDWEELWVDAIERGTADLCLIVTGPLTNLAMFRRLHPEHYARLENITVMGGAFTYPGNTTPSAEWNFWVDPHAAKDVFAHAPAPLRVCSLGVTEQMVLTPEGLGEGVDKLGASPLAGVLEDIVRFYFEFHEGVGEGYLAQIHDLLTCQVALGHVPASDIATTVDVEADSPLMRGTAVADVRGVWEREPNAMLVTDADTERAWRLFNHACAVHHLVTTGEYAATAHARAEDEPEK